MLSEVDRVLISRERIAARVREMASDLAADLSKTPEGSVVFIPVMTGALVFVADLIRELPVKLALHLVAVSSYPGLSTTSKGAKLQTELPDDLRGKHVVILDDILDSGQTLALLRGLIEEAQPASVRIVVLLDKQVERHPTVDPEFVRPAYSGFEIPDEFVVGYGLDHDGFHRNLPDVCTVRAGA